MEGKRKSFTNAFSDGARLDNDGEKGKQTIKSFLK